jgi:hypothetical protein
MLRNVPNATEVSQIRELMTSMQMERPTQGAGHCDFVDIAMPLAKTLHPESSAAIQVIGSAAVWAGLKNLCSQSADCNKVFILVLALTVSVTYKKTGETLIYTNIHYIGLEFFELS